MSGRNEKRIVRIVAELDGFNIPTVKGILPKMMAFISLGFLPNYTEFRLLPPVDAEHIPPHIRQHINFITSHIHGERWEGGDYDFTIADKLVEGTMRAYGGDQQMVVYVKGREKAEFFRECISEMTNVTVVNLDDNGCPSLKVLAGTAHRPSIEKKCGILRGWCKENL